MISCHNSIEKPCNISTESTSAATNNDNTDETDDKSEKETQDNAYAHVEDLDNDSVEYSRNVTDDSAMHDELDEDGEDDEEENQEVVDHDHDENGENMKQADESSDDDEDEDDDSDTDLENLNIAQNADDDEFIKLSDEQLAKLGTLLYFYCKVFLICYIKMLLKQSRVLFRQTRLFLNC